MNSVACNPSWSEALLRWYDESAVPMPWRGSRDPYRIWLSEIMLQQTRVTAVEAYYRRFLAQFPKVEALAAASLDEVLKAWEGLGYYSRARNLHRLAQIVAHEMNGQFPASSTALQSLPGIGRYTAAAIASIAFDEAVAVLDGNVMRVLARLMDLAEDITTTRAQQQLWAWAESLLPPQRPGDYNQALMDLGRRICVPRRPLCTACPWQAQCLAFARGTTAQRPVKKPKAPLPHVRVVAAVLRDAEDRILLVQRPLAGLWGGLWALPGGQCNDDESLSEALQRIVRTDLGLNITVAEEMAVTTQQLTHLRLTVRAFACHIQSGTPHPLHVAACTWAKPEELEQYSFGKADRALVEALTNWQPRLFAEP